LKVAFTFSRASTNCPVKSNWNIWNIDFIAFICVCIMFLIAVHILVTTIPTLSQNVVRHNIKFSIKTNISVDIDCMKFLIHIPASNIDCHIIAHNLSNAALIQFTKSLNTSHVLNKAHTNSAKEFFINHQKVFCASVASCILAFISSTHFLYISCDITQFL
jgi:hypothetical protein